MTEQLVIYEAKDRIGYITLNRPEKRNALNAEMVTELKAAFAQAENDANCKVIVLQANGEAFCAGADLGYLQQLQNNTFDENLQDSTHLMELFSMIYKGKKAVIGKIQGHALAGGCGLATVCDISFSVPEAKFGYTEVKIGFVPAIVKVFLLRKIGEGKARELLLTGKIIAAEEAKNFGLINFVTPKDSIDAEVLDFATKLCVEASGQSIALVKEMIAEVQHMSVDDGLAYAAQMNAHARATDDCKRGIQSFLNKEKLSW
jgi:methylglutaconyl-CoA hydratase